MLSPQQLQYQRNRMFSAYYETEKRFLDLIRIIPIENGGKTFSPILYDILLNASVQVENMLRLLCDRFDLKYDSNNFPTYYKLLNQNDILKQQTILLIKSRRSYEPFVIYDGTESPSWWKRYNATKHHLPEGYSEGNLENTILALSGIYALHCMAYYAQHASEKFFEYNRWITDYPSFLSDGQIVRNTLDQLPKSELFYCQTRYSEGASL